MFKIIGIYEVPAFENQTNVDRQVAPDGLRFYVIRIGYPVANIEDNIPLLIGSIMGNIMSMPYLKLLDIDFLRNLLINSRVQSLVFRESEIF